jgi:hypothetical protein
METPTFLYKPNFCAECGEKIERERWHFWSSRRFCDECEPVYRLNRLLPPGLAVAAVFFGGIFFGQMGQKTEKSAPVLATQAALAAERPLVMAPKPTITSQTPPTEPPLPGNTAPNNNTAAAPFRTQPTVNSAFSEPVYTCGARTQKGAPCSRRVRAAGLRCWQHLGKPSMLDK